MKHTAEQVHRAVNILNDRSVVVNLFGGKSVEVKSPTCGTIEEACRYLTLLPKEDINTNDQNLLGKLIALSPKFNPMYSAIAILLYGETRCNRRMFLFFGSRNVVRFSKKIKRKCAPKEVQIALTKLLGSQICSDFFGLVSAMMSVLIVETE